MKEFPKVKEMLDFLKTAKELKNKRKHLKKLKNYKAVVLTNDFKIFKYLKKHKGKYRALMKIFLLEV